MSLREITVGRDERAQRRLAESTRNPHLWIAPDVHHSTQTYNGAWQVFHEPTGLGLASIGELTLDGARYFAEALADLDWSSGEVEALRADEARRLAIRKEETWLIHHPNPGAEGDEL